MKSIPDARDDSGSTFSFFSFPYFRFLVDGGGGGGLLNPFTTGNPFLGTKLLGFSMWRGSGALKGLTQNRPKVS